MLQRSTDDRLAALNRQSGSTQYEGNAFADGILGMWWGAVGAGGVVITLASILGGIGLVQRGTATIGILIGWAVASSMMVVFIGSLVGVTCGFASAAVAHYARGSIARAVSGILS